MTQRQVLLPASERAALIGMRDTAAKAYLRERAAALLKVADGIPAALVAQYGLLRARQPDTVYAWLDRFAEQGVAGLTIRPGRGRKPAFSPSVPHQGGRPRGARARAAAGSAAVRD